MTGGSGIVAIVPRGSGAYVIHNQLEDSIANYRLFTHSPAMEYFPFALPIWAAKKTSGASMIHSTLDYGWMYRKKGIPLILTAHNYLLCHEAYKHSTLRQRIHYSTDLRASTRMSIREADLIVCVSDFTRNVICEKYKIYDKTIIIYNGIDCNKYYPNTSNKTTNETYKVLFAGNLSRRKGAHWIPEIAAKLEKGIEIHIATGLRNTELSICNDNIKTIGRVSYENMPSLYRQYDALLSPTVLEGFGLSIAEAMACGLPVVASDCSFVSQLVHDGRSGYLCRIGDCAAFAEALNSLAKSPATCASMSLYNRQRIMTCFPLEKMINGYKNLFNSLV